MSMPVPSSSLLSQDPIGLSVDLLFVGSGQFALMLHLRGTRFCISGVSGIRHRIFALLWQSEIALGLCLFLRCCKFCHIYVSSPFHEHVRCLYVTRRASLPSENPYSCRADPRGAYMPD